MMDCKEVNETLFLFVDNEMGEDRRIPFRDHIARCSGCSKKMDYTLRLILIVRQRCVRCNAPATLRHRILTSFPHRQKQLGPLLALLAALGFAAAVTLGLGEMTPAAAQELALGALGGERLVESDLGHGATVVVIWASWSPRSRNIVERVNNLAGQWQGKARVITVDFQEDRSTVQSFLAGKDLHAPVYLDPDGALAKKYAIATLPGLLVLKDGAVAYRGQLPDNPERVLTPLLH